MVTLQGLTLCSTYHVLVRAYTSAGAGPFSPTTKNYSLLVGLVMIMFIAPVKNRFRGYTSVYSACHWEAQREQPRSTFDDVTTTKPNLTTRLLGSEEHLLFRGRRSAGQLAEAVERRKIHGSTFACICCILHVVLVDTVYFLMHRFAANTAWQKYQPSYIFML